MNAPPEEDAGLNRRWLLLGILEWVFACIVVWWRVLKNVYDGLILGFEEHGVLIAFRRLIEEAWKDGASLDTWRVEEKKRDERAAVARRRKTASDRKARVDRFVIRVFSEDLAGFLSVEHDRKQRVEILSDVFYAKLLVLRKQGLLSESWFHSLVEVLDQVTVAADTAGVWMRAAILDGFAEWDKMKEVDATPGLLNLDWLDNVRENTVMLVESCPKALGCYTH